jgi:hypothetical protein
METGKRAQPNFGAVILSNPCATNENQHLQPHRKKQIAQVPRCDAKERRVVRKGSAVYC